MRRSTSLYHFLFFNDTATTEIYTLSLHDALPISCAGVTRRSCSAPRATCCSTSRCSASASRRSATPRSEEHTSELQSHLNLVCRLLLEKKKREQPYASSGGTPPPKRTLPAVLLIP